MQYDSLDLQEVGDQARTNHDMRLDDELRVASDGSPTERVCLNASHRTHASRRVAMGGAPGHFFRPGLSGRGRVHRPAPCLGDCFDCGLKALKENGSTAPLRVGHSQAEPDLSPLTTWPPIRESQCAIEVTAAGREMERLEAERKRSCMRFFIDAMLPAWSHGILARTVMTLFPDESLVYQMRTRHLFAPTSSDVIVTKTRSFYFVVTCPVLVRYSMVVAEPVGFRPIQCLAAAAAIPIPAPGRRLPRRIPLTVLLHSETASL